jgi:hypothetical protein
MAAGSLSHTPDLPAFILLILSILSELIPIQRDRIDRIDRMKFIHAWRGLGVADLEFPTETRRPSTPLPVIPRDERFESQPDNALFVAEAHLVEQEFEPYWAETQWGCAGRSQT